MKILKVFVLSVFCALALASARAESMEAVRIHAPFPFVAGGRVLPAGNYVIQQSGESGVLIIRGEGRALMVLTTSGEPDTARHEPGARFEGSGGERHLQQVQMIGAPARIVVTRSVK